ncbi:MAG TPA: transglutaminase, partial [Bradyrhizobium sp.]|nr:transglutaminase [Bradyrhizobium sp.]
MFGFRGQGKRLAVVAILLGISPPASAGEERALYASLGDTARSPIGWVEFCADNPGDCRGGATQPRDI